jgi:D-allose transport system permease protein
MKLTVNTVWQRYGTFGILLLIVILLSALSPQYFMTATNLTQVALQSSITILMATGEFFTILIAGIDLSVGSIIALTGLVTAKLLVAGVPVWIAILAGTVMTGALLGAINGLLVNGTGLHPFIITLGTQAIYRGFTLVFSNARPVFGFPSSFTDTVAGWIWKIPVPVIIAALFAVLMAFVTQRTKMGRNFYAIGGNRNSAFYSGINVKLHVLIVFIISGVASGVAGMVTIARLGAAEPLAGVSSELYAIASAIIGGTSFFGGVGKIFGVAMGGLILGVINNGLNILTVPTFYQQIVTGTLIIGAVFIDNLFARKKV